MDIVLRAAAIYVVLLLLIRIAGRRTLGQMTTFDLVLVLVIGEATQQALLGDDFSLTTAVLAIATLIGIDIALSELKRYFPKVGQVFNGEPMLIVENGRLLKMRMSQARVDEEDILASARKLRGLERLDQIRYAILEADGHITIIPAHDDQHKDDRNSNNKD